MPLKTSPPAKFATRFMRALRFWSRIGLPVFSFEPDPHGPPVMAELAAFAPLAGAVIALAGAALLLAANALNLPSTLAAVLALAALALATGGLHEDGLADLADSVGGRDREQRLAIMKDPRLGSFGALALFLTLAARLFALSALVDFYGATSAAALLLAAAALSRSLGLLPLVMLPPARLDGVAAAAGALGLRAWLVGAAPAALIAFGLAGWLGGVVPALAAVMLVVIAVLAPVRLAGRLLGGQTGDVCGAATILSETAFLIALLVAI